MPDQRVLHAIAAEMGIDLGLPDADSARSEIHRLGDWSGSRPTSPQVPSGTMPTPALGEAVLSSWRMLLDNGRMQDGEPNLAGTARLPLVRLSAETAARSAPTTAITLRCRLNPVPSHYRWRSPNSRLEQSGSRSIHRVARSTKRSALPRVPW